MGNIKENMIGMIGMMGDNIYIQMMIYQIMS